MTNTNTNTPAPNAFLAIQEAMKAETARRHNLPEAANISAAIDEGIDATAKMENACLKLTHAFFVGLTLAVDERGNTLINREDARRFCAPWNEGVTVTDEMRKGASDSDKKFIDGLCDEWSTRYMIAAKRIEELRGQSSTSEAVRNELAVNLKTVKAVKAMVRRAIASAYWIVTQGPEKVNLDAKKGVINIVTANDRHSMPISILEESAKDTFPSKNKPKGTQAPETDGKTTSESGPVESVINSVIHLRKYVDVRRFNTLDATTKAELKELYTTLTACFAVKDEPVTSFQADKSQSILIKKAKA